MRSISWRTPPSSCRRSATDCSRCGFHVAKSATTGRISAKRVWEADAAFMIDSFCSWIALSAADNSSTFCPSLPPAAVAGWCRWVSVGNPEALIPYVTTLLLNSSDHGELQENPARVCEGRKGIGRQEEGDTGKAEEGDEEWIQSITILCPTHSTVAYLSVRLQLPGRWVEKLVGLLSSLGPPGGTGGL